MRYQTICTRFKNNGNNICFIEVFTGQKYSFEIVYIYLKYPVCLTASAFSLKYTLKLEMIDLEMTSIEIHKEVTALDPSIKILLRRQGGFSGYFS